MTEATPDTLATTEIVYVGFWLRFLAFLLDSIAAFLVISPLIALFFGQTNPADFNLADSRELIEFLQKSMVHLAAETILLGVVFVMFWILKSATPGKMLIKSSIVDARTFGKASGGQSFVRYLGYFLSLIPFGLGFLWIAFDSRKQGWHDKLAGTVVIKGKPEQLTT